MKSNRNLFIYTAIFTITIFTLIFVIFKFTNALDVFNDNKNTNFFTALGSISNIIMAVVSIFNILLIVKFYFEDKELKKREEKANNKLYWFRTFILQENIKYVENFFQRNLEIIKECKALEEQKSDLSAANFNSRLKSEFGKYTEEKMCVTHSFTDLISVTDPDLGQAIKKLFENFQDEFTVYLSQLMAGIEKYDYIELTKIVHSQKSKIIGKLYNYGINNCSV